MTKLPDQPCSSCPYASPIQRRWDWLLGCAAAVVAIGLAFSAVRILQASKLSHEDWDYVHSRDARWEATLKRIERHIRDQAKSGDADAVQR